jgi:Lon-like ATP-dependent protease
LTHDTVDGSPGVETSGADRPDGPSRDEGVAAPTVDDRSTPVENEWFGRPPTDSEPDGDADGDADVGPTADELDADHDAGAEETPTVPSPLRSDLDPETDLLGGLDIETTADVAVPERLVDQVIGQERAREVVLKAASQRRHVMMIGSPGVGKSMLARALSELLPRRTLQDVLVFHNPDDANAPLVRTTPAGTGGEIVAAHREEARRKGRSRRILLWVAIIAILGYGIFIAGSLFTAFLAAAVVWFIFRSRGRKSRAMVPKLLVSNGERRTAPFVDATGAHAGALLGDVRHDPYQSGGMETPSHDRVEAGSIHKADGGVLFVDEINTLDIRSQQHLMTAIQEGAFPITGQSEQSSGAMVKSDPVPTDFVLIAAGNLDAMQNMHPALRSRIKGYGYEVYMDDSVPDTPAHRRLFARFVAQEVRKDGRLPEFTREAVCEIVREAQRRAGRADHLTLQLRALGGLVRAAGDIARDEGATVATRDHVLGARRKARSIEQQIADGYIERRRDYDLSLVEGATIGRVNGLAVMGEDSGIVLPVMAEVTPSQGPGGVIATGKLQEIAAEAVENVSAIVKKHARVDLGEMDVHIQFLGAGEGGVDGDSASVTVATAVVSALEGVPVDQTVAMTGSLSVRGDVLPVGGVTHKVEAAAKAGLKRVIVPASNLRDVMVDDEVRERVEIVPASHLSEVLAAALVEDDDETSRSRLLDRLSAVTESVIEAGRSSGTSPAPQ